MKIIKTMLWNLLEHSVIFTGYDKLLRKSICMKTFSQSQQKTDKFA